MKLLISGVCGALGADAGEAALRRAMTLALDALRPGGRTLPAVSIPKPCAAICSRRNATSSSSPSSVEKPGGLPVPAAAPGAGDRRHVDRRRRSRAATPSCAWASPLGASSRASAATLVPSTERRWSMMPSE